MSYCTSAASHPEHQRYHDSDYGFPIREDAALFERFALEINQAGLSWLTILKKQAAFRRAFDGFDLDRVAVHCGAGLGRTGTILAAYLVRQGVPPAEAIAAVRTRRPGSIETAAQEAAVIAFGEKGHSP